MLKFKKNILFCVVIFFVFLTIFYCDKLAYQVDFSTRNATIAEASEVSNEDEIISSDESHVEDYLNVYEKEESNKKTKLFLWVGISIISLLFITLLVGLFIYKKKLKK